MLSKFDTACMQECSSMLTFTNCKTLLENGMKKLKVVEVLQYNGVNMKVISTKRTTVKMGLLHYNTPVV